MTTNTQKEILKEKEKNINTMNTSQILWHLVYRHRVVLLITSNLLTLTLWTMRNAPAAIHSFTR